MPRYSRSSHRQGYAVRTSALTRGRGQMKKRYFTLGSLATGVKEFAASMSLGDVICIHNGREWNQDEGGYDYFFTISKK